jgi:hypothetical protein
MFSLEQARFVYDPFPMGVAKNVFDKDLYEDLVSTFPTVDKFAFKPTLGKKYSLSEGNNPAQYYEHLQKYPRWREFYQSIKTPAFVQSVLDVLKRNRIDLGLSKNPVVSIDRFDSTWGLFDRVTHGRGNRARTLMNRFSGGRVPLKTRFEFSMLPADGGHIKPHTDAPNKLITLVIPMVREGEWNPEFGGSTDMLKPKDISFNYNHLNSYLEFDQVERGTRFPFEPNQCSIFIKTFNSWHAVYPMTGHGSPAMRRTVTLNIETA